MNLYLYVCARVGFTFALCLCWTAAGVGAPENMNLLGDMIFSGTDHRPGNVCTSWRVSVCMLIIPAIWSGRVRHVATFECVLEHVCRSRRVVTHTRVKIMIISSRVLVYDSDELNIVRTFHTQTQ